MTTGEIIRNRREELQMTQEELAELVGYRHKTSINKIESGKQKIMQDKILVFAKALQFTPEQLMGWDTVAQPVEQVSLSADELNYIEKYRALDDHGRGIVDYVLNEEYCRTIAMQEDLLYMDPSMKIYPYLGAVAAAGSAVYPGDIPIEQIKVRKLNGADFIVGVIGLFIVNGYYYIKELAPDGLISKNPKWPTIPKDRDIIVVGKVLGKVNE